MKDVIIKDKEAVRRALEIAIESELDIIRCHHFVETEPAVIAARANILAFKAVLRRRYKVKL